MRVFVGSILILLAAIVTGCSLARTDTWVVGQEKSASQLDKEDIAAGMQVARRYIVAWTEQDYGTMYKLRNKHCRGKYPVFIKCAKTWRQKGVKRALSITLSRSSAKAINKSLRVLYGISDEQAQILLSLGVFEEMALDQLRKKKWPDRVMLIGLCILGHKSVIILVKEDGQWSVANDPGTLDTSTVLH